MSNAIKCPKCSGEMVQGFILDSTYGRSIVSSWVEGPPKSSFWGLKVPFEGGIPIGAFRCKECGYLELYASTEFAAH